MTAPIRLQVQDLQVCLAGTKTDVVSEVDFEVAPGEVLGLVGESGSGKTTVALALLGYARRGLSITGGQVLVDGQEILGIPERELLALRGGQVAYVPQEPAAALNPVRRVGKQVAEVLRVHEGRGSQDGDVAERVREVLSAVDLPTDPTFLRRFPHQLSGGQQQRIVIAMAFACRPGVIVFDEPTNRDRRGGRRGIGNSRIVQIGRRANRDRQSHPLARGESGPTFPFSSVIAPG